VDEENLQTLLKMGKEFPRKKILNTNSVKMTSKIVLQIFSVCLKLLDGLDWK